MLGGLDVIVQIGGSSIGDEYGVALESGRNVDPTPPTLTPADVTTLSSIGLRTVVDFRLPGEVLVNGEDRRPGGTVLVSLPMPGADVGTFYDLIASGDHDRQQAELGQGRATEFMLARHRGFLPVRHHGRPRPRDA